MPVVCPRCRKEFPGDKLNARHLAKCDPGSSPKAEPCLCGHISTSLTQMKRHRKTCAVWAERDSKAVRDGRRRATSLERWGVEDASHAPEVVSRRKATCLERYGAENPSARGSSIYADVQKALEGKRPVLKGADNPFARPEVQEKIRATMTERHGAENPQQVPEIRERTRATCLERWGVEEVLASPAIREKIKETCEEKYGGPGPSCSPEVRARQSATNMARFGVPWTAMDPEVRRKQLEAMEERYGAHFFASEEGKAEVRRVLMERYGVEFPSQIEGHWEKAVATFRQNYPGFLYPGLLASRPGPNKFELSVSQLIPEALYTGNGKFWRWLSLLGHNKNPDFVVPGPDPEHPFRGATKVVEAFGDFWHSRMFTGKANFAHERELVDAWAAEGFDCLVVWEGELKAGAEAVRSRLAAFIG